MWSCTWDAVVAPATTAMEALPPDKFVEEGGGYGEIAGEVKKRLLPFAIPFTARFTVQKVAFTTWEKQVYLQVEQIKPLDLEWVTARLVGKIPFLSCREGVITCDLARVPRLAEFFSYRLKGMLLADMLTVKELSLREGELVGRLGVCL